MCGRFTLLQDEMKIKDRFKLNKTIAGYTPSYNIAPGQNVLAIIYDGKERRAGYLRWGLVPFWAKDEKIGNNMINARSETIHEKPSFKRLLGKNHCLLIADSFYEWKKVSDGKVPQRIQLANGGLFAFAGLWDRWEQGDKTLFTCTLLTRASDQFMKSIHHRMPIILSESEEKTWLEAPFADGEAVQQFLQSIEPEPLTAYAVSNYVNHAKHNDVACIEPIIG